MITKKDELMPNKEEPASFRKIRLITMLEFGGKVRDGYLEKIMAEADKESIVLSNGAKHEC